MYGLGTKWFVSGVFAVSYVRTWKIYHHHKWLKWLSHVMSDSPLSLLFPILSTIQKRQKCHEYLKRSTGASYRDCSLGHNEDKIWLRLKFLSEAKLGQLWKTQTVFFLYRCDCLECQCNNVTWVCGWLAQCGSWALFHWVVNSLALFIIKNSGEQVLMPRWSLFECKFKFAK